MDCRILLNLNGFKSSKLRRLLVNASGCSRWKHTASPSRNGYRDGLMPAHPILLSQLKSLVDAKKLPLAEHIVVIDDVFRWAYQDGTSYRRYHVRDFLVDTTLCIPAMRIGTLCRPPSVKRSSSIHHADAGSDGRTRRSATMGTNDPRVVFSQAPLTVQQASQRRIPLHSEPPF